MSELDKIATALVAAQKDMKNPSFDSQNPHFRSKFASLASVREAVVPVLNKHGIHVSQNLTETEHGIACTTIFTHTSGQQMSWGPCGMPASKADAQGYGSASTYARRYSLMAAAGVVGEEDDDGNAAVEQTRRTPAEKSATTKKVNEYSQRIMNAVDKNDVGTLADIQQEVRQGGEEFRISVWTSLPKPVQDYLLDNLPRAA